MIQVSSHYTKKIKIRHIKGGPMSWIEIELFGTANPHIPENKFAIFGLNDDFPDLEVNWGERPVAGSTVEASVNEDLLAALKSCENFLANHERSFGIEAGSPDELECWSQARAAIAKVEGGK